MDAQIARAAHYLKYLAIYWIFAGMWLWSFWEKLADPVPQWFVDQFGPTFVDEFPGLTISWRAAGVAELAVGLVFLVSLARLEFLPGRRKPVLLLALGGSACLFAYLGFGQRITDQFDSAASLFFYFGATIATWIAVQRDDARSAPDDAASATVS